MARIRKSAKEKALPKLVWNIALYIRLSKDDGNDESLSVTNQKKILTEYLEQFFDERYILAGTYIDDGVTGTDYVRPGFQRMLQDVEAGKVTCIICKNLSRAFRNYSDQGYFLEKFFPMHSIRFITLGNPKIDTFLNPEAVSGLEIPINGLMNDRFAYKTSSDIRRTFDTKRRKGEFIGAFAPYGYTKHPNNKNALIIDEEAAGVVRNIFKWFVYGDSTHKHKGSISKEGIARKLNRLGIPNPALYKKLNGLKYSNPNTEQNDGLWSGSTVSRILQNKVYIGTMVQGKQRVISYKVHDTVNIPREQWYEVEDTHKPVISRELFELAQDLQKRDTRTAPGKKENYLFAGFLKCADCGKSMTRRSSKGIVYYNCSTYKRKSKDKCTKHTIRLDVLENAVLLAIQKQIELCRSMEAVIKSINNAPVMQAKIIYLSGLLKQRQAEQHKTENLITGLYVDWKSGELTLEEYRNMKAKFEHHRDQLISTVGNINEEIKAEKSTAFPHDPYLKTFLKYRNIKELSQGILNELIEAVYIHENKGLTIRFKFNDEYKRVVLSALNSKDYPAEVMQLYGK